MVYNWIYAYNISLKKLYRIASYIIIFVFIVLYK